MNDTQLHCHTHGSNLRMLDCIVKTKDLIDYALNNDVYPDQIGIVNINGFATAFAINKKGNNYIELREVIVDWDEIGYKRIMENLIEEKKG